MVISFTRFSNWLWGGKEEQSVSNSTTLNSSSELGFPLKKRESKKLHKVKETKIVPPSHRKVKRKWKNREGENRIDREFDVVLVPSDGGGCLSGSESDDSDYSVGWLEPHGPSFHSDEESDDSFAVLVPCYRHGGKKVESSDNELLSVFKNLPDEFSDKSSKKYIEQWLDSLKNLQGLSNPVFYH
ncbi:uncharacterized protein LOC129321199 [Prosopis cineraria]|uniref:uncharacterized protein LOC129321199 n=1 Tax=Prosopis cineraria TaxID=364024 RepID=UPI00240F0882|nr:uncharacterized protein LOC129321199 [Prosopis cineraria]XP_054822859.1 uncharacterized protein LOC129321199 [Prosopis cineraria]